MNAKELHKHIISKIEHVYERPEAESVASMVMEFLGITRMDLALDSEIRISFEALNPIISRLEKSFNFNAFESIHVEYSHKYLLSEVKEFARQSGFKIIKSYTDSKNHYLCSLWQVEKQS